MSPSWTPHPLPLPHSLFYHITIQLFENIVYTPWIHFLSSHSLSPHCPLEAAPYEVTVDLPVGQSGSRLSSFGFSAALAQLIAPLLKKCVRVCVLRMYVSPCVCTYVHMRACVCMCSCTYMFCSCDCHGVHACVHMVAYAHVWHCVLHLGACMHVHGCVWVHLCALVCYAHAWMLVLYMCATPSLISCLRFSCLLSKLLHLNPR